MSLIKKHWLILVLISIELDQWIYWLLNDGWLPFREPFLGSWDLWEPNKPFGATFPGTWGPPSGNQAPRDPSRKLSEIFDFEMAIK